MTFCGSDISKIARASNAPFRKQLDFRLRGFRKVEARSHSIRLYCSDILIGIEYWSFGGRRIDGVIYQFCQLQHSHIRPDLTVVMADGPIDIDYVSFGRRRVEESYQFCQCE